jgi:hypothetical protein
MGFLSVGEAATVLSQRVGSEVSARQLRYVGIGSVASADGSRLYDAEGLAICGVYFLALRRFAEWNLPAWKARAAVLYLEPAIRAAFRRRVPSMLVLDPFKGTASVQPSAGGRTDAIALRSLLADMRLLIEQTRAARPEVWTGRELTEEPELLAV